MTKLKKSELRDLVKGIYEERTSQTITNKELEPFIDDVFFAIEEALLEGNDVPVGNIGTFKVKDVAARTGINPLLLKKLKDEGVPEADAKKQAQIEIKPTRKVSFTQSSTLKNTFKAEQA